VQAVLVVRENNMSIEEQYTMQAIQQIAKKINNFTLRDYFAGQALAGMGEYLMQNRENLNEVAESCYKIADVMVEYNKLKK
jgi:hypothetical protein